MRPAVGRIVLAALTAAALAGCRHPAPARVFYPPAVAPPPSTVEVPSARITPIEPALASLPLVDPTTADVTGATRPPAIGLTETTCVQLAVEHAPVASAVERENAVPVVVGPDQPPPEQSLLRELRPLVAAELRNRAGGEAVAAFYQLADVEARAAVVRESIESLEVLRKAIAEAKEKGAKPPIDEEVLAQQRATWIGLLGQAELGAKLLDADLKRRIGASGKTTDRLMPTGEFGLPKETLDTEAAVAVALERRPDLIVLRTAYLKLSPDTLPEVRELLRTLVGSSGMIGGSGRGLSAGGPRLPVVQRYIDRRLAEALAPVQTAADYEVAVRRGQLFTLIDERERAVADEVRAQALVLSEQARQVGLARWRVEKLKAKVAEQRAADTGAALRVQAELDLNRERAELIQAVMAWHQARAKLTQAQGLYAK